MVSRKTFEMVDLFAGFGGASLGAERAGARVLVAANHWGVAVRAHQINHPETTHLQQDLNQANFHLFPDHDGLWASPACQGHSQAANGARKTKLNMAAKHDALRSTAWAVVNCLEAKRPEFAFVENVLDFKKWELFDMWMMCIEKMGYSAEIHVADSTAFGVPQRRKRLIIAVSKGKTPMGLKLPSIKKADEPSFGPCIDWNDEHVDAGEKGWEAVSSKPEMVQYRIKRAREEKGKGETFLTQYVTDHPGVHLSEAIRTITTKSQWALVHGDKIRMLRVREIARAMGFPDDYRWPAGISKESQIKGLGNAVTPAVAEWFIRQAMAA